MARPDGTKNDGGGGGGGRDVRNYVLTCSLLGVRVFVFRGELEYRLLVDF